jgi:DNA-binding NarL/FixJ family response regulator
MVSKPKMALIVAQPGPLRNSLFSLLAAMPQINLVAESRDIAYLAHMAAQIQPDIVLIETGFAQAELAESIHTLKAIWPFTPTIVLVDDPNQKEKAEQAAADVVLFKGFRAASLIDLLDDLLAEESCVNPTPSAVAATPVN